MTYIDVGSPSVDQEPPKTPQEGKKPSTRLRQYWRQIEAYNKSASEWREQGEKIVKLYLDQHKTAASPRRFALLWSNIETLKPAVYAKIPTILCSRRYKDPHPVGRTAAEILERATNTTFDLYDVDEVFRMVRDDRLLVARGQAWVRYEASFKKTKDGKGDEYDKLAGENVCVDYVHWCDFGHNVAGTWKDVWCVWRKVYKTRAEATERFGEEVANQLGYTAKTDIDGKEEAGEHTACIYEIWDKKKREIVFISKDYPEFLEEPADPPLNFMDFFPCPEPCYGTKTGKSLIPTPDYRYYQDQANEIDDLTDKIANLTDYLQVRAFVPAGPSADGADAVRIMIQTLQSQMTSNKSVFVPVESWAGFTEKGGAGKLIDWLPIDMVIKALEGAVATRKQLIEDVYQITGVADILRGETDPNETLGAQQLKAQTGSRRIKNAKDEVARFCRDVGQLVAEVIAEQFSPQTLAEITGYTYQPAAPVQDPAQAQMGGSPTPQPMQPGMPGAMPQQAPSRQTFDDEVIELIRSDRMRSFLIDIETDSTIQPDEDAEKQRRVEFVTAIGGFMREAMPAAQMSPSLVPMLGETLLFLVRGFRAGRSLEETIERSMQQMVQQIQQAQANPQPDPKVQAEQAKLQTVQAKAQADMAVNQQEVQIKQEELQMKREELGIKQQEMQVKAQMSQQEMAMDAQAKQQDMALEQQERTQEAQFRQEEMAMNQQAMHEQHEMKREQMSMSQEAAQSKHDMGMEMMKAKAQQAKPPKKGKRRRITTPSGKTYVMEDED